MVRHYGDPSRSTSSAKRKSRVTTPCDESASCFSVGSPHGNAGLGSRKPLPVDSRYWLGWVAFGLLHEEACEADSTGGSARGQNTGYTGKSQAVEHFGAFPSCGGASHMQAVEGLLQLVCPPPPPSRAETGASDSSLMISIQRKVFHASSDVWSLVGTAAYLM